MIENQSADWVRYFQCNTARPLHVDLATELRLTEDERKAIVASIQQFQLGESGEGKHLLACARKHAAAIGDEQYPLALQRFVYEEQHHAKMLAEYLLAMGAPTIAKSSVDNVFRFLRHLMGLELSLIVLSTAEVVATVYYRALRDATGCPALRVLCQRILFDESMHLAFQRERFGILRQSRSFPVRCLLRLMHHGLLFGTNFIVWRCHSPVFKRAGVGFMNLQWRTNRTLHRQLRRIGLRTRLRRLVGAIVSTEAEGRHA